MNIPQIAHKTRKVLRNVTLDTVTEYLEKHNISVMYMGTSEGDEALFSLGLSEHSSKKSFTYFGGIKIVFLHVDNKKENLQLLLHELGHIELKHFEERQNLPDIHKEREAEIFAYTVETKPKLKTKNVVLTVLTTILAIFALLTLLPTPNSENIKIDTEIGSREQLKYTSHKEIENIIPESDVIPSSQYVYVMPYGERYHHEGCQYINENAERKPLEAVNKTYSACAVCCK